MAFISLKSSIVPLSGEDEAHQARLSWAPMEKPDPDSGGTRVSFPDLVFYHLTLSDRQDMRSALTAAMRPYLEQETLARLDGDEAIASATLSRLRRLRTQLTQ